MESKIVEIKGRLGFGIYAMSKWEDIPREYLLFIVSSNCKTSKDVKDKAKIELNNRKIKFPISGL